MTAIEAPRLAATRRPGRWGTWRAAAYLALSLPLGALWLVLLAGGLVLGSVTAVAGVGLVVLLGTLAGARTAGEFERHLVNAVLGAGIPAPPRRDSDTWRGAVRNLVTDPRVWRSLAWLVLRGLVGVLVLGGAVVAAAALVALLVVPFVDGYLVWGGWRSSAGPASAWTLPVALLGAVAVGRLLREVAAAHVRTARLLLGPDPAEQVAGLTREAVRLAERTALARDLHDSVGHAVTVIVLQAESARRLLAADPEAVDAGLRTIGETGRRALAELDDVLAVLAGAAADEAAPVRSQPSLAELPELLRRAAAAGLPVRAEIGDADELETAARHPASAVAYRVVQEACTNVMRHAGGAPVVVRVGVDGAVLRVEVHNERPATAAPEQAPAPGRGLAGLEERVRLAGGLLSAGPAAGGGWSVVARLPARP